VVIEEQPKEVGLRIGPLKLERVERERSEVKRTRDGRDQNGNVSVKAQKQVVRKVVGHTL
jgi:hypothetical protein